MVAVGVLTSAARSLPLLTRPVMARKPPLSNSSTMLLLADSGW